MVSQFISANHCFFVLDTFNLAIDVCSTRYVDTTLANYATTQVGIFGTGFNSGTLDHLPNNPNLLCILDNISIILVCCEGNNHVLGMITGREQLGAENSCT